MYSWRTSLRPRDDTRSFTRVDRPLIGRDSRYTVVELERPRCKVAGPVKVMLTVSTVPSSSFLPSKKNESNRSIAKLFLNILYLCVPNISPRKFDGILPFLQLFLDSYIVTFYFDSIFTKYSYPS